ncbi:restriction endonuclease subunit S [Shewanella hafniensis]|uniref:restriction endonuclease subunit S n=1 Tax=Shewanella hafniensis TaxID=365590 RepID=UPI001BBA658F|nr:restriction endonuclease subunit S [Shewanella hafniensis]MCL1132839.1 restriction endonuclease subunit S [Shewanella hafniensis]GIU28803.1 restriction endonuclease subunit S [Shewanella hafniensis]
MSHLTYMEKLLDGAEVEWLPLGEIGKFIRGNGLQKKDFIETGFPAIHYGQIYTKYGLSADETFTYISEELAKKLRKAERNDLLLATTSENDEDVVKPLAWLGNQSVISGDMMLFRHEQNVKYLAHYFLTEAFQAQKRKYITGAKVRRVSSGDLSKIVVPIPCPDNPEKSLAIQAEIVRILDAFTAMTAELTAELNMRKKQYNYYRDQLLSFEEGEVEWKTLEEIGHIVTGRTPRSSDKFAWGDDVDFVTPSDIKNGMRNITCPSRRLSAEGAASMPKVRIPSGSLLVTCIGADMGKTVINANECIPNQQINAIILTDDSVQVGYLFHVLTAMRETLRRQGELGGGTMPLINKSDFSKIVVPVPSYEEQNRIATILDKFDALTNSIIEGLPREIELRQKQYEYYRDLLLSFPRSHSHEAA